MVLMLILEEFSVNILLIFDSVTLEIKVLFKGIILLQHQGKQNKFSEATISILSLKQYMYAKLLFRKKKIKKNPVVFILQKRHASRNCKPKNSSSVKHDPN